MKDIIIIIIIIITLIIIIIFIITLEMRYIDNLKQKFIT